MNPRRLLIVVLTIAVLVAFLPVFAGLFGFGGDGSLGGNPATKQLTISEVVDQVRQGKVKQISVNNQSGRLVV